MKLNNNLTSLLSLENMYASSKILNKSNSKDLNKMFVKNTGDSVSISESAKQIGIDYKDISTITKVNNKEIIPLKANNNSLDFRSGNYYDFQTKNGRRIILRGLSEGQVSMPFSELNVNVSSCSRSYHKERGEVARFFNNLSRDMSALTVRLPYTKEETLDMLSRAGVQPGFFTIQNDKTTNEFYLLEDGTIYPKYQSEAHRGALNHRNYFESGYTKDSRFIVDGNEYKLDDDGYLHIPEGTACLTETIEKIK
ncbi:MAG: hypothetical protein GY710_26860 [Desulfobacteraceae bacterium]|nr:hypothetical protein [Desulfobacteraceae bacterium]